MKWLERINPLYIETRMTPLVSQMMFFLMYAGYLVCRTMMLTTLRYESDYARGTRYVLWICFLVAVFIVVFLCKYTVWQVLVIALLTVVFLKIYWVTSKQEYFFLQSIMIVFAARETKWTNILKFTLVAFLAFIGGIILLSLTGEISTVESYRGDKLRLSLGFSHPNSFAMYLLCVIFMWVLLRFEHLRIYDYVVWGAIAAFTWWGPNSKATTFSILLLMFLVWILKRWGTYLLKNNLVRGACLCMYPLMALFSFLGSYFYQKDNVLCTKVDKILFTGRLGYAHEFLLKYPITLFGQKIKLIGSLVAQQKGTTAYILDNFYMRTLINSGVIAFILMLVMFVFLTHRAIQMNDKGMLAVLMIMAVYSVYENYFNRVGFNILFFQLCFQLFRTVESGSSDLQVKGKSAKEYAK
ncbi:MAG: hypothetical protein LUF00_08205 [Lachnospiraceae bacterium]|nr:hypothetical protein [Lachnospiraceae bacterium]